ncbi:hypothetical protein RS84_03261 [Microbacterium hydrocarbonoxydans]|uniref:Transposase IS204/IS1001/IS1096/IS1165 DDE domain-containing protein n=1 Tax=Microbacterium hydrocarbonoxydans TaxID=273678 RepID=A0A0M2HQ60_9MICO|nr:hypothetical protein RS84_03261 [Microbacterium hydrocarbonoxydans]
MIVADREPDKKLGRQLMQAVIDTMTNNVPATLVDICRLGRTLKQRATDILAFFDRPGTSNGQTEAINGRLEHLRGSALGFRNFTNGVARSLVKAGGFRPHLHSGTRRVTLQWRLFASIQLVHARCTATPPVTRYCKIDGGSV